VLDAMCDMVRAGIFLLDPAQRRPAPPPILGNDVDAVAGRPRPWLARAANPGPQFGSAVSGAKPLISVRMPLIYPHRVYGFQGVQALLMTMIDHKTHGGPCGSRRSRPQRADRSGLRHERRSADRKSIASHIKGQNYFFFCSGRCRERFLRPNRTSSCNRNLRRRHRQALSTPVRMHPEVKQVWPWHLSDLRHGAGSRRQISLDHAPDPELIDMVQAISGSHWR